MNFHFLRCFIFITSAALFCSCAALVPQTDLEEVEKLPLTDAAPSISSSVQCEWWKSFESRELNDLVSQALSNNPSLAQAAARFRQARAAAGKVSASSMPSLSASAEIGQSERTQTGADGSTERVTLDSYRLGLAASYELDMWGRVHSMRSSANLKTKASFLDLETAAMSLAARVCELWVQVIEAEGQLTLVSKQIELNRKSLDLLKERATKASTTLLDVYQQEHLLRTSEARLPDAKQRLELLRNELAVLLGRHAGVGPEIAAKALPDLPPFSSDELLSSLLENRPDVRAQQLRLKAAGWDVASARADRLPAIRLSARYDYSSEKASALFDNWIANLAAGLIAPLIDGGIKRSEVERSKAALDEALARYRETILSAYKDVKDSMIREKRLEESVSALERQLESAKMTFDEASSRYSRGSAGYLSVLSALRSVFQSEQSLLSARSSLLQSRIALHRALGGTWIQEAAESVSENDFGKTMKDMNNE